MARIEDGLGPRTAREAGVKGGINVGGPDGNKGTAKDVGFGGSSTNTVGSVIAPNPANAAQNKTANQAGQDAQAAKAFGANAQRIATNAAQRAFGPAQANGNVYQAAGNLMHQRAAYQFARGGDVNRHGLYKALHAMGYKTDGMNVIQNMSNPDALNATYKRLVNQANAKANAALRGGMKAPGESAPTVQDVADKAIGESNAAKKKSLPKGVTVAMSPYYARGGADGDGDSRWSNVGGYLHQMDSVDANDETAVANFNSDAQKRMDFMTDGDYFVDNRGFV